MTYRVIVYPSHNLLANNDIIRQINISKECVPDNTAISICFDIEKSTLTDDFKTLLLNHTNLILISCNFKYKPMLQEKYKDTELLVDNLFSNDIQSFIGNMLSPKSDSDISTLNSDTELDTTTMHIVIGFLIYNSEIMTSIDPLMSINNNIKNFKIMYPKLRLVLILQAIRDMAVHFGKCASKIPIASGEIDELICQLLLYHQVDTVETHDSNESFEYIFKTCNTLLNSPTYHGYNPYRINHVLSKNKKGDMSDIYENIWINQLMQVPGLGENGATIIAQRYKTPLDLINAGKSNNLNKELENIQIPSSKGYRKLGPVLANRLVHMFCTIGSENDFVIVQSKKPVK